jgi:general secretion pathway protein E
MITTQAHLASSGADQPVQSNGANDSPHALELRADLVSRRFRERISRDFARQHLVISQGAVETDNGTDKMSERLAVSETTDPVVIFNIGVRLGAPVLPGMADGEAIARLIDEVYGRGEGGSDEGVAVTANGQESIETLLNQADRDLLSTEGKGPIIKLVDGLLFEALGRSASDIHIQPLADSALVRLRLDGVLHTVRELPRKVSTAVVSRIKVMGRMDIAERRVPQDGRATVNIGDQISGGRSIDLRISTLPTSHGERVVIRLLDNTHSLCEFSKLGMPPDVAQKYLDRAGRANGMILLTGPTGSGKTTTLYATLRKVGTPGLNIMTIEDPIEYELSAPAPAPAPGSGAIPGGAISQSQVNPRKGITFATGLRHILRQDPDVVMVGEIRDEETARIAVQASLTGHLVFSTLHTNDAASAITRLIDLGIESYLVSASLSAVLAQRLVRKIHQSCKGAGCDECLTTGFRGRTGLFELIAVEEAIRELISAGAPLAQIRAEARSGGTRTLREDGEYLAQAGITTMAEVHRVVHGAL